jgi:WD40 repeat protein
LCLFLLVSACRNDEEKQFTEYKNVQEINVSEITELTKIDEGKFYNPKFTATGTKAVFTSENYTGLWYYDFKTKVVNQLNPSIGAGINFDVSKTGDKVYFRLQSTSAKGNIRNYSIAEQELNSKAINILYTSQNYLSGPKSLSDGNVAFVMNNEIKVLDTATKDFIEDYDSKNIIAFADGNSIKFKFGEAGDKATPFEEGDINWIEVSPYNDKIFFTSSEKGTGAYILESKEIKWLGDYKYLKCSQTSNLEVHTFYENYNYDLFVTVEGDLNRYNITDSSNENEMFPYLSNDGTLVIYNTAEGIIKLAKLKIITGSNV